jgi:hypothetical protein
MGRRKINPFNSFGAALRLSVPKLRVVNLSFKNGKWVKPTTTSTRIIISHQQADMHPGRDIFLPPPPPPPPHFSKEETGVVIVEQCRPMQSNVDADTFEEYFPDWLKRMVSHSSIQQNLLGDVFWSFNARSSAPLLIQKSAYDLSYLALALRKFTLTREQRVAGKIEPKTVSDRDFDDIFQLRAAFISDYDHYCSDGSSDENQLRISLEQRLPCNSVAESHNNIGDDGARTIARPHLVPPAVREVLQDIICTHNHGLEFHEKHMADFYQALLYESDREISAFPPEIRENLKNYVRLRDATRSQPSDLALSNFELLSCCCIFQFASRYAKHQDELQNPPLTPSVDALPQPLPHRVHFDDDLVVPFRRDSMALDERKTKDDLDHSQPSNSEDSRQQPSAAASMYDLKSEMLKLLAYLRDLHRAIVDLHNSLLHCSKKDKVEKFAKLQRVLLEHKDLLFYGDNDRQMRIRNDRQKHELAALAFQVLRQMILETAYFKDLRESIDKLVANFNKTLREKEINVVQLSFEMFDKLCKAVALEQLHFAFDILEATQGADFGFCFKTRAAGMEAQLLSAQRVVAAVAANAGVVERALERTSSAGVAAAVGDNAVYTWLDLKGKVLSVTLANEKEADLKQYKPRQLIYERLCSFACALQRRFHPTCCNSFCGLTITPQACICANHLPQDWTYRFARRK